MRAFDILVFIAQLSILFSINIAIKNIKLNDIAYNRYLKKFVIGSISMALGGAFFEVCLIANK